MTEAVPVSVAASFSLSLFLSLSCSLSIDGHSETNVDEEAPQSPLRKTAEVVGFSLAVLALGLGSVFAGDNWGKH